MAFDRMTRVLLLRIFNEDIAPVGPGACGVKCNAWTALLHYCCCLHSIELMGLDQEFLCEGEGSIVRQRQPKRGQVMTRMDDCAFSASLVSIIKKSASSLSIVLFSGMLE